MQISEFIRAIEDDSDLGFKIEEFSMITGASTSELQAKFVCKNIPIEGISQLDTTEENTEGNTEGNTTNTTNTTNTANTANKANATNSTNTANTTNTTNTTNTAK